MRNVGVESKIIVDLTFSLSLSPSLPPLYVLQRARVRAMADGACVYVCVLSWLNSRSAGTNYNEPRLVGRESAMFSFLCPVVYRPFYRGHPFPPSSLPPPAIPLSRSPFPSSHHPRTRSPTASPRHPPHPRIPTTIPRRDCPPRLLSHGICLQCGIRPGEEKNFSFLKPGQKKRLENLGEMRGAAPYCVRD